jgi:hypothetical protein
MRRSGFTVLEVLIALTASLLMMLALTRAFKSIGDRISQSQSELELSGTLRNVTFAMRDELDRMTAEMVAPQPREANKGYFTYYEGPWADGTTQLINNTGPQAGYLPTSRFGDLDDYVAFTAKAKEDAPFVGLIPRGVLEAHRFEAHVLAGNAWGSFVTSDGIAINNYTAASAYQLVPFYSDYAEIAYFCAPDWARDALGQPTYDANGHPVFIDVVNETGAAGVGDGIPDRLTLRRRILLIRPDLNMTPRRMYQATGGAAPIGADENIGQVPVLVPPAGATPPTIRPLANQDTRFQVGPWSPNFDWPVAGVNDQQRPTWLTGVARVQQLMDLSVARITNSWSNPGPGATGYGMPANASLGTGAAGIAANSLQSLVRPENRFAHVRIPITLGGDPASTMPMLALCPPHAYLAAAEQQTLANNPGNTNDDRFGQAVNTNNPVSYGRFTMVGFLRPEFSLTDYTVANRTSAATSAATAVPTYRGGADVVASDLLGFDVKVYDPNAPNFVWMGTAGQNVPGLPGDDDGDGTNDELDELGLPNTDDALITVNSAAINPIVGTAPSVFVSTATSLPPGTNEYFLGPPGEFVDFGYVRLGGGMVGGSQVIERLGAVPRNTFGGLFSTGFSGLIGSGALPFQGRYPTGWQDSGRFVIPGGGFAVATGGGSLDAFVQPIVDTWTATYDGDGFDQVAFPGALGNFNVTGSAMTGPGNGVNTRYWRNRTESLTSSGPTFINGNSANTQSEPPSTVLPRAIKISIRVYDRTAGEIRQQSVVHEFPR